VDGGLSEREFRIKLTDRQEFFQSLLKIKQLNWGVKGLRE